MRGLASLCAAAVAAVVALAAAPVRAQDTSPEACAEAYSAVARLQSHVMGAAAEGRGVPSLGGLTDNWLPTYVWEERGRDVARKAADPDRFLFGVSTAGQQRGDELFLEGAATGLFTMLTPERVFAGQRQLFAEVRACDQAHGFDPALGVPPPAETILAILRQQEERRSALFLGRLDELANMDDRQCAARFYVIGSVMANDLGFQQVMSRKMQIAAGKAREADASLAPERFGEMVRREAEDRASKIASEADLDPLLEEVNACERKYGEPLTTRN